MGLQNPLEVAALLRMKLKEQWVVDARIVVEVDDAKAWDDLVSVLRSTVAWQYTAAGDSSRPFEVQVFGVTFRWVRQPH